MAGQIKTLLLLLLHFKADIKIQKAGASIQLPINQRKIFFFTCGLVLTWIYIQCFVLQVRPDVLLQFTKFKDFTISINKAINLYFKFCSCIPKSKVNLDSA